MSWELLAIVLALLTLGGAGATVLIVKRIKFWAAEGAKLSDPAYNTPPAGFWARLARSIAGRVFGFLYVGPIRLVNERALKGRGRFLICPNHQTERDAITIMYLLKRLPVRYLIALSQTQGYRGGLVAWTGGIAVDYEENAAGHDRKAGVAAKKAIRMLQSESGTSMVVFPQGKLVRDNKLVREDFFSGALMIGKLGSKKSEEPFFTVPTAIHYDRDPAHRTFLHKFLNFIGWKGFRSWFGDTTVGATIVFGDPIPMDELTGNLEEGTDRLFAEVVEASEHAEEYTQVVAQRPRLWFLRPWSLLTGVFKGFFDHEITTRASAIAFCAMMATVPLLALLVSVAVQFLPNLAGGPEESVGIGNLTVGQFESTLKMIFPEEAYRVVHEQIIALQTQPRLLTISIGLAITFWAASSLYVAIMDALNRIYDARETRSFICVRLMAMLMTVIQTVILLGSMLIIVGWPQIQAAFGWTNDTVQALELAKWAAVSLMVMLTYALWFRVGPASHQQRSLFTFGAAFGTAAFIAVCIGFRTYVQNFAAYERTYGSLGGVMALLLWYWLSAVVLLLAAEINRVIEILKAQRRLPDGVVRRLPTTKPS